MSPKPAPINNVIHITITLFYYFLKMFRFHWLKTTVGNFSVINEWFLSFLELLFDKTASFLSAYININSMNYHQEFHRKSWTCRYSNKRVKLKMINQPQMNQLWQPFERHIYSPVHQRLALELISIPYTAFFQWKFYNISPNSEIKQTDQQVTTNQ